MKLKAKLVVIMLFLLVIAVCALFMLNQYSQNVLVEEIRESSTEVSKAIQISVADLTSLAASGSRLEDYMRSAKKRGITEINIFNNDGEIINSSIPALPLTFCEENLLRSRNLKAVRRKLCIYNNVV